MLQAAEVCAYCCTLGSISSQAAWQAWPRAVTMNWAWMNTVRGSHGGEAANVAAMPGRARPLVSSLPACLTIWRMAENRRHVVYQRSSASDSTSSSSPTSTLICELFCVWDLEPMPRAARCCARTTRLAGSRPFSDTLWEVPVAAAASWVESEHRLARQHGGSPRAGACACAHRGQPAAASPQVRRPGIGKGWHLHACCLHVTLLAVPMSA